jgi:hypothetical protein
MRGFSSNLREASASPSESLLDGDDDDSGGLPVGLR